MFSDSQVKYVMEGTHIVLMAEERTANANVGSLQTLTITGTVTDANGLPIPGANVVVKGTITGVVTDTNGKYSINVADKDAVLVFSFVGYTTGEIVVGDRKIVDIKLAEDTQELEEVVVVGYGTARRRDIVGAQASVKSEDIRTAATNNINDILQGKVAGVDFSTGRFPGDNQSITIRGNRSLKASNSPLVIIDGVPGSLDDVSTYDIENIEILKDAASTAIYGSRAANGVILVTTKRAQTDVRSQVNFNASYGLHVPHMPPLMPGPKFAQFRRDMQRFSGGWDNPVTDEQVFTNASELEIVRSGNYIDWQELMYREATNQSYYLSLSNNAMNKTKVFMSLRYDQNEGYAKTNERKNIHVNLTVDQELFKFWNVGATARFRRSDNDGFQEFGTNLVYMTPLSIPYREDGTLNFFPNLQNTSQFNPLGNYEPGQYINRTQYNNINLNFTSRLKLGEHLSMTTNYGYVFRERKLGQFYGKNSFEGKGQKSRARMEFENSYENTLNNIITYDRAFGDHSLTVDLVGEIQTYNRDVGIARGENQPVDYTSYYNLQSATENIQIESNYREWSLASVLGRIRYNFKNKYLINVAMRADGSSRLAEGNKWAYFPSVGAAWSMKDEDFMQSVGWINSLKVRGSFGTVGNTSIDEYQTKATLQQILYVFGENSADKLFGYRPSRIVNSNLGWEISRTLNAGADFGLWNNTLSGYVEWYHTKTSDVLVERTIPNFNGFSTIWQNIGKTQNTGIEANFRYMAVKKKDFTLDFTFNISRNWQKILELVSGNDLPNNSWFIGQPFNVYYALQKIGIWQLGEEAEAARYAAVPGEIKVKDQDGDGAITDADDKVILGQTIPKVLSSLGASARYKNFDITINLNSKWGYMIRPEPYNDFIADGKRWVVDVDYWTPDNPTNDYQKADRTGKYDTYGGTQGYMKADHIKLQDITIGYNFQSLVPQRLGVKAAKIYAQFRNIGYLYRAAPYDIRPEAPDFEYTIPNSYILGLNLTF
jgi:TonB-linked SusC/RagA family outer membrane protein